MASVPGDVIIVIGTVIILNQEMQNVFDLRITGAGSYTDVQVTAAVRMWMNRAYAEIVARITDQAQFQRIDIRGRSNPAMAVITTWDMTGWPARSTGEILPAGVAGLVTFPTTNAGTRGRKYVMGFTEGNNLDGVWIPAMTADLADFATQVIAPLAPAGSNPGLEYVVVKEGVGAFTAYRPTAALVRNIPAYQRRRRQGVGI